MKYEHILQYKTWLHKKQGVASDPHKKYLCYWGREVYTSAKTKKILFIFKIITKLLTLSLCKVKIMWKNNTKYNECLSRHRLATAPLAPAPPCSLDLNRARLRFTLVVKQWVFADFPNWFEGSCIDECLKGKFKHAHWFKLELSRMVTLCKLRKIYSPEVSGYIWRPIEVFQAPWNCTTTVRWAGLRLYDRNHSSIACLQSRDFLPKWRAIEQLVHDFSQYLSACSKIKWR